jgi:outer membrane protein OmpA-like peptidoglycan-associated protein
MRGFILHIILLFSLSAFAGEIEIYNEIYQNISIGETANAIKLCKKQIKKDKKNPTWPYLLGEAYLQQGDYALGIETLSKLKPSRDVIRLMKNCLVADSLTKHHSDYQLRYLGDSLNTIYNNIWPTLTPTEDVFFTTVVMNGMQEDIYYSLPLKNGNWDKTKALPAPLNSNENEGSQSFSADGKYMFFVRCNQRDGYGSCDIYYCIKTARGWSRPINAGNVVNSNAWESTPSVSADFTTLYFSSNQRPNKGGKDIFKAEIGMLANGILEFYNVKNLGDSINTIYDETAPFIHPDGVTLYFSSSGHESMGGLDVFYSRKDSTGVWRKPQNMGYPLNNTRDNFGFCTNLIGDKGYISAHKDNLPRNNMVIYEVTVPREFRPQPTIFIKEESGLQFSKISDGTSISLNNILFEFNKSTLLESSFAEIDKVGKILTETSNLNVEIVGHTDSIGSAEYNEILSMKRAISVRDYLVSKGISAERINCIGMGASKPLLPNTTEENRAKNRRIEFKFYSKEK